MTWMQAFLRWLVYGQVALPTTSPFEAFWVVYTLSPFVLAVRAIYNAAGDLKYNDWWTNRVLASGKPLTGRAKASMVQAKANVRDAAIVAFLALGFAFFGVQAALLPPRPLSQGGGVVGITSPLVFIAMASALNALILLGHRDRETELDLITPPQQREGRP